MPRVLLILPTTTYRARDFVQAAVRIGVEVTVASEEPSTVEGLNPAGLLTLDLASPEAAARQAAEFAARHPIDAVVPADDQATAAAAAICRRLGLEHNAPEAVLAARDKGRARELLAAADVPSPAHELHDLDGDLEEVARRARYPCVLKPLGLSASRGVMRADDAGELIAAAGRLRRIVDREGAAGAGAPASRRSFLVEEYIGGAEVAVEGLITRGRLRTLALFDKPDAPEGPCFEETILVTPSRLPDAVQRAVAGCAGRAAVALGLRHGPVHIELRVDARGPWIIEINPRSIGGLCSRALRFGLGVSLEEVIIAHALGREVEHLRRETRPAGVMMIPVPGAGVLREVRGVDEARALPGIEDVVITARPGETLVPLPEGSRYPGFIFARAGTPAAVEEALRTAHRALAFTVDR
jgi:biotin carboxylase